MNTFTSIRSLAVVLLVGATGLSAQSCAATNNLAAGSQHAINASGEALSAGGASVAASAQVASAVVAVPVWIAGTAVEGSGEMTKLVGDGLAHAGKGVNKGGDKLWDFASGDTSQRPALNHDLTGAPAQPAKTVVAKDPSPGAAMKSL